MVAVVPQAENSAGPRLVPSHMAATKTPQDLITEADQIRDRLAHLLEEIAKMISRTHVLLHELEERSEQFEKATSFRRNPREMDMRRRMPILADGLSGEAR